MIRYRVRATDAAAAAASALWRDPIIPVTEWKKSLLGRKTLWSSVWCFIWYVEFFSWSFLDEGLRLGESDCVNKIDCSLGVFVLEIFLIAST